MTASGVGLERHGGHPGIGERGRSYAVLCLDSSRTIHATRSREGQLLRLPLEPKTGARRYFDNFLDAARRAGNLGPNCHWDKPETLVKGHTHLVPERPDVDGHDERARLRRPDLHPQHAHHGTGPDGGRRCRSAQYLAKGVFHERSSTYTLEIMPERNLVISIGVPNCTIATYNPATRETKRIPGVPWRTTPSSRGAT